MVTNCTCCRLVSLTYTGFWYGRPLWHWIFVPSKNNTWHPWILNKVATMSYKFRLFTRYPYCPKELFFTSVQVKNSLFKLILLKFCSHTFQCDKEKNARWVDLCVSMLTYAVCLEYILSFYIPLLCKVHAFYLELDMKEKVLLRGLSSNCAAKCSENKCT